MQIVPSEPGETAQSLHAELQTTRCMSTKYKSDLFPRCVACTRRWAGDTCRFQGIRYFLRDIEGAILGVSFCSTPTSDMPHMKFPQKWNEELTSENIARTRVRCFIFRFGFLGKSLIILLVFLNTECHREGYAADYEG